MSMEFESARTSSYIDPTQEVNSSLFNDPSMDYLQFDHPASPGFDATMGLNSSESPMVGYSSLGLSAGPMDYTYSPDAFQSSPRNITPPLEGISPPMLSYQLGHGEASDDSLLSSPGRRNRGAARHSVPYAATVPRSALRYNPISVPSTRSSTRVSTFKQRRDSVSASVDKDSEGLEEEDDYQPTRPGDPRREEIRKQRIDSEQKRRDDLRDSFNSLKAVLPPSSQKASKIVIIERSIQHIREQSAKLNHAEQRIRELTMAVERERQLSEQLALKNVHHLQRFADPMAQNMTGF